MLHLIMSRKRDCRELQAPGILPVHGDSHVEDGDHDLDATGHGRGTEDRQDPLLVRPELAQLRHYVVKLHLASPLPWKLVKMTSHPPNVAMETRNKI